MLPITLGISWGVPEETLRLQLLQQLLRTTRDKALRGLRDIHPTGVVPGVPELLLTI